MKIGILGGGQLSRMLALAGIPLGFEFLFYFPKMEHSLSHLGHVMHGAYDDFDLLNNFAQQADVITYESENIPLETVQHLMTLKPVRPDAQALATSQDRYVEKTFFSDLGVPTNQFMKVDTIDDAKQAIKKFGYPLILKKRTQSYDGKGQAKINNETDLDSLPANYFDNLIAEEFVPYDREVSLIIAKSDQESVTYDICENTHHNGILNKTRNIKDDPIYDLAKGHVTKIINQLNYTGVLAVEFFQVGDKLIANEMAPRVHNSGHWTIDGCVTSQFENHLRAITSLPLGSPESLSASLMLNILGNMPNKQKLLEVNGLCLHDYCKKPAPNRKLGHATIVGINLNNIADISEIN